MQPPRRSYPRDLSRLDPPAPVREIVARLERAGHETWCVGGAVRDALLGHAHLDWDLATSATPTEVQRTFKRTVPVGIEFGTIGVLDADNTLHEVTTFRRDVHTDGRHAVVEFGVSLDDDLARRDFTINAIAYHPQREEFRDPFEGRLDLKRGIVRAVGAAGDRMTEDRLRALRAIRFAARFGFHIEPGTWAAIVAAAPFLDRLSSERVKQELEKTMEQVARPSVALEWWRSTGALAKLVPAIASAPKERFEALDHLPMASAPGDEGKTLNRLAMLFFGESADAAQNSARALKFSNADVSWIASLCGSYAAVGRAMDVALRAGPHDPAAVRRWVATIGRTRTSAFVALYTALWRAHLARTPDEEVEARLAPLGVMAEEIAFRDPVELSDLAIDGEDLQKLGVPPGPKLGRILRQLLDQVIADPTHNTREVLLPLARTLAAGADH